MLEWVEKWEKKINDTRGLFTFSLALCEIGLYDRIEKYLSQAEKMQDRDKNSKTYGNFKWYLNSEKVVDLNSVEFCLREGFLIWIRHKERLSKKAVEILERLLIIGINGVLNHSVSVKYTNIFLIKTWNLIAFGENFNNEKIKNLGYKNLDEFLLYTRENGIREYSSPNYYHVDITALGLIYNYTKNEEIKRKSEIALKLFWTDIALNFFEPSGRLGGSKSRDYDYVYGRDGVESLLTYYGWIKRSEQYFCDYLVLLSHWTPPEGIKKLNQIYPRFIERKIGNIKGEWACHYIGKNFSLGVCGVPYSPLDKPLVFLFPSDNLPNGYLIFDARNDPYGEKAELMPWAGGEHKVYLHLVPFFTSYQNENEIIMYANINAEDPSIPRIATNVYGFYTHFVFPNVEVYKNKMKIELKAQEKIDFSFDDVLILKYKNTLIGIKIFYATDLYENIPEIYLINDGNKYNLLRLTVVHSNGQEKKGRGEIAFHIKGEEDIDSKRKVEKFFEQLKSVRFEVKKNDNDYEIYQNSSLKLKFNPIKNQRIIDREVRCILGLNGKDLGKEILDQINGGDL
ncbi:MAG: hypothetical protein NC827_06095 [Candidatus Omnitrophica bacterium]|nr:hypothetical protein [Candidatus Omnitrophota bacterium]MCM8802861.1 hypothetical protein [Candidatus Omnitrophota bacterium]